MDFGQHMDGKGLEALTMFHQMAYALPMFEAVYAFDTQDTSTKDERIFGLN